MQFINLHHHLPQNCAGIRNMFINDYIADNGNAQIVSVGIHPYFCACADIDEKLKLLTKISANKNIVAIGETGLDKSIDVDFNIQQKIFAAQLQIAQNAQKPLIIHNVRAINEILQTIKLKKITVPFIFHGFKGKPQMVNQICKAGGYVSFGSQIIQNSSWDNALLKALELNIAFFETDDDKSTNIEAVYEYAAKISQIKIDVLKTNIAKIFTKIFKIEFV